MKALIISIIVAITLIIGTIMFTRNNGPEQTVQKKITGTSTVLNGGQTIEITAKGGYWPQKITAQANMPTVIKVKTEGTFDCSSALYIPSIGYRGRLPLTGTTEINVPLEKTSPGNSLRGVCAMGMYNFTIDFK